GRLRFSQDARLRSIGRYAYTKYDDIGRVWETGTSNQGVAGDAFQEEANINNPNYPTSGGERTWIRYDLKTAMDYLDGSDQTHTRNRVSYTETDEGMETYYSYDVHGNVEWVAQKIPGWDRINFVRYEYDLISGNVNQ